MVSGWKCPGCGACYAPHVSRCVDCASPRREQFEPPRPGRTLHDVVKGTVEELGPCNSIYDTEPGEK